jgi:hypothetical protein
MAFKRGTLKHAKGYVINKLWKQDQYGGKHVPVQYLSQGYPPKWRHLIGPAVEELKSEGMVRVEKRTGRDSGEHATLVRSRLPEARGLLNGFRSAEGLPRLGRDLKTLLPVRAR